jgi:hypothetical protein
MLRVLVEQIRLARASGRATKGLRVHRQRVAHGFAPFALVLKYAPDITPERDLSSMNPATYVDSPQARYVELERVTLSHRVDVVSL